MKIRAFLSAALLAFIFGCMSTGQNFDGNKVSQIKKGETTEAELLQWFGPPQTRGINAEGVTTLTWTYTETNIKGQSFIPFAGPFVGGANSQMKMLLVKLQAGKVQDFTFNGGTNELRNDNQEVPK